MIEQAERLLALGDESGAAAAFIEVSRAAHAAFDPALEARAQLGLGSVRLAQGDDAIARRAFDEAIHRAVEGGDLAVEAEAWFQLANAWFDAGRSKDGHDSLLEAMALHRQIADTEPGNLDNKRKLARAIRVYGEHIGVLGSESDSKQALKIARFMYQDIGDSDAAEAIDRDVAFLTEFSR